MGFVSASPLMLKLLTILITFRSNRLEVVHETDFAVGVEDAWKICKDYSAFIRVMLRRQKTDPAPEWIAGGPGEVGGELRFTLDREGQTIVIVERVVRLDVDTATGAHTLSWEQLSSEPRLPIRNYGCTWVLTPAEEKRDSERCRLTWTRYFDEPMLLGLISLSSFMIGSLERTALPILDDVFRSFYAMELHDGHEPSGGGGEVSQ